MAITVFDTRTTTAPIWHASETESSVMMVVHMDRFLQYATKYALAKAATQHRAASMCRKHMLKPASMRDARARDNRADYEDVLSAGGSAAAAKLFRAAKLVNHATSQEKSWKAEKTQCQWKGCPKSIRTKRDMRLAEKRRKLREKQLAIPAWDARMTAALYR